MGMPHECCQCNCPTLPDGTQRFGPTHNPQPGKQKSQDEKTQEWNEFRRSLPMGTSTRCEKHNAPRRKK